MPKKEISQVTPETLSLVMDLERLPELKSFHLAGGIALAIHVGHRKSNHIELLDQNPVETNALISAISNSYKVTLLSEYKHSTSTQINSIKTDFICHSYPYVKPPVEVKGLRLLAKEDLAAMKLLVICNSGKRLKDFIDLYFLLEHFSIRDMIGFFSVKYKDLNPIIALRAINFFEDIDPSFDPPEMEKPIALSAIKKRIQDAVLHSKKTF